MYNPPLRERSLSQRYATARQVALEVIRDRIISGHLKPGARLDIGVLSREIGVSHIPIREALNTLEAEGLIVISPHRSIRVSDLTSEMLQEIYTIRLRLEPFAAGIGTIKMTEARLKELENLIKKMHKLTEDSSQGDDDAVEPSIRELSQVNRAFHFVLYESSGLRRLCRILSALWDDSQRYIITYIRRRVWRVRALEEHEEIYRAVQKRDAAQVETLIAKNLESTRDAILDLLNGGGGGVKAGAE